MADSEGLYTGHPEVKYPTDKPKLSELKLLTVDPEELEKRGEEIRKRFVEIFGPERDSVRRRRRRGDAREPWLDRALRCGRRSVLALVFLMALPLGWLVWMSVRGDARRHARPLPRDGARPGDAEGALEHGRDGVLGGRSRLPSARRWRG